MYAEDDYSDIHIRAIDPEVLLAGDDQWAHVALPLRGLVRAARRRKRSANHQGTHSRIGRWARFTTSFSQPSIAVQTVGLRSDSLCAALGTRMSCFGPASAANTRRE